ncbi:MAG TPA: AcrB/AcrD/AcrF family protein [Allosphingosinicella sp.]|nr:AcrB/AcrD/AcrF family protein [Allosphingosinicella sp.]
MAGGDSFDRHWRLWVLVFWAVAAILLVYRQWNLINWFALGDTDDNLRMMQVRGLLGGQGWYDLRQYRLDPPAGADIHWSRLADLPIAAIMLLLKPFMSGAAAERVAVALAPMLPMAVAMGAVAVVARRLVSPRAYVVAIALLLCAHSARAMWTPLRIDHHGWQLAMLSLVLAGLTDSRRARGGIVTGLASAGSLAIGLEMLVYLAAAGAATGLMWVRDRGEARRLAAYGASLAGGAALGFLLFASYANRAPVCDALSPVWLSAMIAAGALAVPLAFARAERWPVRLAFAAAAGAALAAAFALVWPHCLGRLEGVSPELEAMWLGNVREARPVYRHSWQVIANVVSLPAAGLAGYGLMLWRSRHDPGALVRWAPAALLAAIAAALLLWQTRAGAAAQLLSIPGASALAAALLVWALARRNLAAAAVLAVILFSMVAGLAVQQVPQILSKPASRHAEAVNQANSRCPTLAALRPVAQVPKGYVLTFVDLGPRLVTVTHHDAVAGPYHRNQAAILDVMKSFRGSPDFARSVIERRGIDYVLICPGLSESTVHAQQAPDGFYVRLSQGRTPGWLEPVPLPAGSPYRMWRVLRRRS